MLLEENTYIDVRVKNIRLMSNDLDSSSPLKWSKEPCYSDPVTVKAQYNKLTEDWRHINTMTWGVPAVAVTVMSGLILAAYQPQLEGWPRIVSLGVGSLLLFALTIEVIKKRLLMSAISGKLEDWEGSLKFSASTGKLIDYVDNLYKNSCYTNPDQGDPIYRIFKWSYARQYLTYVTFVAGILISILTELEFIKYLYQLHYGQWLNMPYIPYIAGLVPVVVICVGIGIARWRAPVGWEKEKEANKTCTKTQ